MQIILIAAEESKNELVINEIPDIELVWIKDIRELKNYKAPSAVVDLSFQNNKERVDLLEGYLPAIVIINSVDEVVIDIHPSFTRINAWPGFLSHNILEASTLDDKNRNRVEEIFMHFNKQIEWLPDEPGFVSARIISMIINEAFLAKEEGVSSEKDMDTAMKLGTNYPSGPFEWAEKIGSKRVTALLKKLSEKNSRYTPAPLLMQH